MIPSKRLPYVPIIDRPPLKLPAGTRLVVWPVVNVEVWDIGRPMPRQALPPPTGITRLPDVPHWAWHVRTSTCRQDGTLTGSMAARLACVTPVPT